jgi:DME family drug/metabolite transporter
MTAATGTRTTGIVAVAIAGILWGTTGTAATLAPEVGPLAIGAAALGIGGLLQAVIAIPALRRERAVLQLRWRIVGVGGLAVAVYPLAFYSSMHLAGVAVGTVVSLASAPLAAGLLERIIDGTRLGRWWILAAVIGVLGSAALCVSRASDASVEGAGGTAGGPGATLAGIGLGLIAGLTYAAYSWAVHRLLSSGTSRGASMGAVFGVGGLLLMPVLALTGAPLLASPGNLSVGLYMALVPMFLGYVAFGYGLVRVPASTATTITLIEPAVAAVLAVVVVGERLSGLGWVGLAVIGVALVVPRDV